MRRALGTALILATVAASPAAAALTAGAPRDVRVARAADALPRPDARLEEWSLQLVDPRSPRRLAIRIQRSLDAGSGADIVLQTGSETLTQELVVLPAEGRRLSWSGPDGSIALTRRGGTWRLRLAFPAAEARLTLRHSRPGVSAGRWRLGQEASFVERTNVSTSWAAPVGTSVVSGPVRVGDRTLRVRRWRGTLEHRWGHLADDWRAWEHLASAAIHTRAGGTWLLHGMNRRDFLTGSGARDAFWLGVMAHVTSRGTSFCRPRIVRRRWIVSLDGPFAVERLRASCGGRRISLRRLPDTSAIDGGPAWHRDESRAVARPRGAAWIRYAGHPFR